MSKIITQQMLEDKLEGLTIARKATIDENDSWKLDEYIKQYRLIYKEFTGKDYEPKEQN